MADHIRPLGLLCQKLPSLLGQDGPVTGVPGSCGIILGAQEGVAISWAFHPLVGAWRSPVARLLWEQEVLGSNPGAPTTFRLPTCNELATEVVFDVKWCY